jgi:hypothetical protein
LEAASRDLLDLPAEEAANTGAASASDGHTTRPGWPTRPPRGQPHIASMRGLASSKRPLRVTAMPIEACWLHFNDVYTVEPGNFKAGDPQAIAGGPRLGQMATGLLYLGVALTGEPRGRTVAALAALASAIALCRPDGLLYCAFTVLAGAVVAWQHRSQGWRAFGHLVGFVAFGVPANRIDDDALHRALKAAQLDAFVSTLPKGIETFVGERGVRLSGGQRQRIGLARAFYGNPKLVVLDEPNANLDEAGELTLSTALREAKKKGIGVILISHRPSVLSGSRYS